MLPQKKIIMSQSGNSFKRIYNYDAAQQQQVKSKAYKGMVTDYPSCGMITEQMVSSVEW